MTATLKHYLQTIEQALKAGNATEHTHRPALKALLETLDLGGQLKREKVEVIAVTRSIRELPRLRKQYGRGRWKLKGIAHIRLISGRVRLAEICSLLLAS